MNTSAFKPLCQSCMHWHWPVEACPTETFTSAMKRLTAPAEESATAWLLSIGHILEQQRLEVESWQEEYANGLTPQNDAADRSVATTVTTKSNAAPHLHRPT